MDERQTSIRRETTARMVGTAVALLAMFAAYRVIGWPAPAVSVALGFAAYWLLRPTPMPPQPPIGP